MLTQEGADFDVRLYFKEPITAEEVSRLAALAGGIDQLISKRARPYAALGLADKDLSEAEWVELFQTEPRLLRRPIVTDGERIVIGYNEEALRDLIARQ